MSAPFAIGFIGAGGIAGRQMAAAKAIEGVVLAACADPNEPPLVKARREHGVAHAYTDYRRMLAEEPALDAVSVCTPNALHAAHAIAALEAGKHVLVEKPMAMNAAECRRMVDAARRAGRHLVIGFQLRFDARTRIIRDRIAAGDLGRILFVRCRALRRRGIPNWGVFGRKDLQGGGPLIDIGVHVLEMAHAMIGSPQPIAASGSTYTYLGDKPMAAACPSPDWDWSTYTVEDLAVGHIRLAGGARLSIETSFAAHIAEDAWNVEILGERGGASWQPTCFFRDEHGYMVDSSPHYLAMEDNFAAKLRHFVAVCRDGATNEAPGEHGLMVQQMIDGIYRSAEAGREVEIGEAGSEERVARSEERGANSIRLRR